jgi:hypothetical protein
MSEAFLSTDLTDLHSVEVNFANSLQLTGVGMSHDFACLNLKLRWRLLRAIPRPWRCFAHLLVNGKQVSSLDHEILRRKPPITCWEPGDEGYESLRVWMENPAQNVSLRLGVYDPSINVRQPVLASTLPVADECSAVCIGAASGQLSEYFVRFDPCPLTACELAFEHGVTLRAYSVVRQNDLVWLRLKWILRRGRRRSVRFFGHVVTELAPEASSLAQFDHDLAMECDGLIAAMETNAVRSWLEPEQSLWLRAGLFDPRNQRRWGISGGSFDIDPQYRCAYIPLRS